MSLDSSYLPVSDGLGDAALMHVTASRSIGATTIKVDTVANVPQKFIATYGEQLPNSEFIDPSTAVIFYGHLSGSDLEIDGFIGGSVDNGNSEDDVVVIRPNSPWANLIAESVNPTGSIIQFAGSAAPNGYLICDGNAISRTTYAALFNVIGTNYGVGDGSTTFNLPNFKGNVAVGYDSSQTEFDQLGETGGSKTQTLTTAQLPSHSHSAGSLSTNNTGAHTHPVYKGGNFGSGGSYEAMNGVSSGSSGTANTNSAGNHSHTISGSTGSQGSGNAHNNLQPYLTVNYLIKT